MKKEIKIGLLAGGVGVVVIAGAILGPQFVNAMHFQAKLEADAKTALSRGPEAIAETCNLCHGQDGNPANSYYPGLAGQPASYIQQQLTSFASGERKSPQMAPLALALAANEQSQIADYYSKRPSVNRHRSDHPVPASRAVVDLAASCTSCHGQDLRGGTVPTALGQIQTPGLAGQGGTYLANQLRAFRSGDRQDASGSMKAIAAALDDPTIEGLAAYLSEKE